MCILAVEQMQALPFATQLLGFLGAEVVKVEHPVQGDSGRDSRPALRDVDGREVGASYLRNNLDKESLAIDLKPPEGVALVRRLVPRFDVFGETFRPGTLERLGLGRDDLRARPMRSSPRPWAASTSACAPAALAPSTWRCSTPSSPCSIRCPSCGPWAFRA